MSMQMDTYLKKEQIGTLFVWVGAPEGGFGGWVVVRGAQFKDHTVQTLYHRVKMSFFALRGDCAHKKYLFILGVRD